MTQSARNVAIYEYTFRVNDEIRFFDYILLINESEFRIKNQNNIKPSNIDSGTIWKSVPGEISKNAYVHAQCDITHGIQFIYYLRITKQEKRAVIIENQISMKLSSHHFRPNIIINVNKFVHILYNLNSHDFASFVTFSRSFASMWPMFTSAKHFMFTHAQTNDRYNIKYIWLYQIYNQKVFVRCNIAMQLLDVSTINITKTYL